MYSSFEGTFTKHHPDGIQDAEAVLNQVSVNRVHNDNDDKDYIDDGEE